MSSRFSEEVGEGLEKWPRERPGQQGSKRAENRRHRLDALCEAGLKLFLERGVDGVTVEEIAHEAGVAKGSFYRYFRDKRELIEAILKPVDGMLDKTIVQGEQRLRQAQTQADLVSAYERLAEEITAGLLPNLDIVLLYLQEHRAPGSEDRGPLRKLAHKIFEKALASTEAAHHHGLLRAFPPAISTHIVLGAVERLLFSFLQGEDLGDPKEVASALISLILDGIWVGPRKHRDESKIV